MWGAWPLSMVLNVGISPTPPRTCCPLAPQRRHLPLPQVSTPSFDMEHTWSGYRAPRLPLAHRP